MNEQNIDLVIFGGLGDLAGRKLLPALYQIERSGLLSDSIRLAVVARDNIETQGFLEYAEARLKQTLAPADWSDAAWRKLARRFSYLSLDFSNKKHYERLSLGHAGTRIGVLPGNAAEFVWTHQSAPQRYGVH